jgi:spore coat polysaccharide biosynthesis protein SpsF (cytidylyltransferase family)
LVRKLNNNKKKNQPIIELQKTNPINVFITVRSNSSRFPNKCFQSFGDYTVIEHVIRRALHFDLNPVVCTTLEQIDSPIASLTEKLGVRCFRGPTENKLLRCITCT